MDIHQMRYVLAVAKHRNFTLAAESCYISQSSLSQQISNLEKELGVRLFSRTTRAIQITEAGEAFVKMASEILRDIDTLGETMSSYSGFLRGTINIGTITALDRIRFNDLISDFYSSYPSLTLNIYQDKSISLLDDLEKRTIDVAFIAQPSGNDYPNVEYKLMGIDEYTLILPENHPLASREMVDLSELKDERFIMHHPEQSISGLCYKACREAGFTPNVVCRIESSVMAFSLVRAGLGVSFCPSEEFNYFQARNVKSVRLVKPVEKRIVMAMNPKNRSSHLISTFIRFVEEWMAKNEQARLSSSRDEMIK